MQRIIQKGKFFFRGEEKFYLQGISYGPFREHHTGQGFYGTPKQADQDFAMMAKAGLNTVRLYHPPANWLFDKAASYGLYVMASIPWDRPGLFLNTRHSRQSIRDTIRKAAQSCSNHEVMLALFIDNEIPADLVRWYGHHRVERFLNELCDVVKQEDPHLLVSYSNFPPTEYLFPSKIDFSAFNIYLHDLKSLEKYFCRLQNIVGNKPLLLSEFGMDSLRHGEDMQATLLSRHFEKVWRNGLAGTVIFSWTDEWFTGGADVKDWAFGIVNSDRSPKVAYQQVSENTIKDPSGPLESCPLTSVPKVSVVICSYNGGATLNACLKSLRTLKYPNFEVILVDDGSTDDTLEIARHFEEVAVISQANQGLSMARNAGLDHANGDIVAYTDDDCVVDEDWLYHLVSTMQSRNIEAVGGPNIRPNPGHWLETVFSVAPGSPCHVLHNDFEAEHVPGCNMAFTKRLIRHVKGFDPQFTKAGDDVDICWRILDSGYSIGFSPGATVWHFSRANLKTYFSQQRGYGKAEALLWYKHFHKFSGHGKIRWDGAIYGPSRANFFFGNALIYHGVFGTAGFQPMYHSVEPNWKWVATSPEWLLATFASAIISVFFPWAKLITVTMLAVTLIAALTKTLNTRLDTNRHFIKIRLLLLFIYWTQPLIRGTAKYLKWISKQVTGLIAQPSSKSTQIRWGQSSGLEFWNKKGQTRDDLLMALTSTLDHDGWSAVTDPGWEKWDIKIFANYWWHVEIISFTSFYPKQWRLTTLGFRLTPSMLSTIVGLGIAIFSILILSTLPSLTSYIGPTLLLALCSWIITGWNVRHRIARIAANVADKLGMKLDRQEAATLADNYDN